MPLQKKKNSTLGPPNASKNETKVEIQLFSNSAMLVFDWQLFNKNYTRRENYDNKAWWISALIIWAFPKIGLIRKKTINLVLKVKLLTITLQFWCLSVVYMCIIFVCMHSVFGLPGWRHVCYSSMTYNL